jgi:hypothetical protein
MKWEGLNNKDFWPASCSSDWALRHSLSRGTPVWNHPAHGAGYFPTVLGVVIFFVRRLYPDYWLRSKMKIKGSGPCAH